MPALTHRAAVIGSPVAHSLSPVLHRAAYAQLGLTDWEYERCEIAPDGPDLAHLLDQLRQPSAQVAWEGLSVTMPHKQRLIPMLDVVDPLAQAVGAVNTVVAQRSSAGALLAGFNTDVAGIVQALTEARAALPSLPTPPLTESASPTSALVLGSGATACSALAALTQLGATRITVAARRHAGPGRALTAAHRMGVEIETVTWKPGEEASDAQLASCLASAQLVVSTLPAHAADTVGEQLSALGATLAPGSVLLDVVYAPWPTRLAAAWSEAGGAIAPGWLMLLHQAVDQVRLMTGHQPDVEVMRATLTRALTER